MMSWRKIYDAIMLILVISLMSFSWYMFMKDRNTNAVINTNMEKMASEIELNSSKIEGVKSFSENLSRGFDVKVVESILSNTRTGFESGFQSTKNFLIELNKEIKTIKNNQASILVKVEKFEEILKDYKEPNTSIKNDIDTLKWMITQQNDKIRWVELQIWNVNSFTSDLKARIDRISLTP